MSRFAFRDTRIPGVKVVERKVIGDERGFLARLFCAEDLGPAGWSKPIAQVNHTLTTKQGTVRGLHFQRPPDSEMKLVVCVRGRVWDVAVDLRPRSPTFLQWHAEDLSPESRLALLIPEGCAHGFQTLTDDCELVYFHSAPYVSASEGALNAVDPRLGIPWPRRITERSARDESHPMITDDFRGIDI